MQATRWGDLAQIQIFPISTHGHTIFTQRQNTGASFPKLTCVFDISLENFSNEMRTILRRNIYFLIAKPELKWQILNNNIN
jgi:hypothetical protein